MDSSNLVVLFQRLASLRRRKAGACGKTEKTEVSSEKSPRTVVACCYYVTMSMLAGGLCNSERLLWSKERSSYWWDFIVCKTFSQDDWLDNSQSTFNFICTEYLSRDLTL